MNGPASAARIGAPYAVWVDSNSDIYLIVTNGGASVLKIVGATTVISEVTAPTGSYDDGQPYSSTTLLVPRGLWGDTMGNLYVVESQRSRVRRLDVASGYIYRVAGAESEVGFSGDGGPAELALLWTPFSVYGNADSLWVADTVNRLVRKLSLTITSKPSAQPTSQPSTPTFTPTPAPTIQNTLEIFTIDTVAGRHRWTNHTGDGGPATLASFGQGRGALLIGFTRCTDG